MFDVNFYMKTYPLVKRLEGGEILSKHDLFEEFESLRSRDPIVYNIETTNACNMRCKMCPRTTRMTRDITFINADQFENVVRQLKPHSEKLWSEWEEFCAYNYGIRPDDVPSENHFFLYVIPKVIQLHGYGDPLLDKNLGAAVQTLNQNGLESYFSCNPANIDIDATVEMMEMGLSYLKYSFESTDDKKFKDIRGNAANFTEAFEKTQQVMKIKQEKKLNTKIIITMIDVGHDKVQIKEFQKLEKFFKNLDVYIYLKSEDQQWYRKDPSLQKYLEKRGRVLPDQNKDFYGTNSIHWSEFCKHPWMSMTIKSDGEVHMCMEDYNNEVFLGDSNENSLHEIWNSKLYHEFRKNHFELTPCIKCNEECDMPKIGSLFSGANLNLPNTENISQKWE